MDNRMIQANKDYAIGQPIGSYKHNRLCASLKCISTIVIMMLCTLTTWGQTYTVTLKAGVGTGDDITISNADAANVATSQQTAANGQFWQEGEAWWFKLPECPNSFKAPNGYLFDGWDNGLINAGTIWSITGNITLTAKWKEKSQEIYASYILSPTNYTLIGEDILANSGYTDITCTLTSLVLGKIKDRHGRYVGVKGINFSINGGILSNNSGNSIPFLVDDYYHLWPDSTSASGRDLSSQGDTLIMAVYINPDDYNQAPPGIYSGTLTYDSYWREADTGEDSNNNTVAGASGTITLTLTIPDSTPPAESYDLTANEATLNGVTKYWTTFYHPSLSYELPAGAMALTMNSSKQLYVVGDGNIIPKNTAVIIMADASAVDASGKIVLTTTTETATPVSGNVLHGTSTATAAGANTYVLSKDANGNFGFFKFTGTIPANKAYINEE